MKRKLLAIALLVQSGSAFSQDPNLDSWKLNTTGLATYTVDGSTIVTMSDSSDITRLCYNTNHVFIVAEGLAHYQMGPFPGNPNTPAGQGYTWRIKRNPTPASVFTDQPPGVIGITISGIPLFAIGDARSYSSTSGTNVSNGDGLWTSDAWVSEGSTMDATGGGHPQQAGAYHYHANPIALYNDPSTAHSPIIGWAFDGYPIYGPFGYANALDANSGVQRMTSSYQLRSITDRTILPDGSTSSPAGPPINATYPLGTYIEDYEYSSGLGTLDEHNGRYCVTPEYPGGIYAYFLATDNTGEPDFPYITGLTYYGDLVTSDYLGVDHVTIPTTGVTCITAVSVDEIAAENNFSMMPNPADQVVTIQKNIPGNCELIIHDAIGRIVFTAPLSDKSISLDVSSYTKGMYFVKIINRSEGTSHTEKLLIAH